MFAIFPLILSSLSYAYATDMANMLMGQTLESFLSALVSFGSMNTLQKNDILLMSIKFNPDNDPSLEDIRLHEHDVFSTEESKQALRSYLYQEVDGDFMEYETAETIASMLSVGALYPMNGSGASSLIGSLMFEGPVASSYAGDGNLIRLGRSDIFGNKNAESAYNGIWGYSVGE
jgi:hypothetical protein